MKSTLSNTVFASEPPPKKEIGADTPWYRRTEFWLAVAALVLGGLLGSGVIGPDNLITKVAGMIVEALAAVGYTYGRTIAKFGRGPGAERPGYRTTEFWQTLIASGLLITQLHELVPESNPAAALIGALLAALPPVSYSLSRGKVKSSGIFIALALMALAPATGCASLRASMPQRLLELHAGLKATSAAGEALFKERCGARAVICRDKRRAAEAALKSCQDDACRTNQREAINIALACEPLVECHAALDKFNAAITAGHDVVLDGLKVLELDQAAAEKNLAAIALKVTELVAAAKMTAASVGEVLR